MRIDAWLETFSIWDSWLLWYGVGCLSQLNIEMFFSRWLGRFRIWARDSSRLWFLVIVYLGDIYSGVFGILKLGGGVRAYVGWFTYLRWPRWPYDHTFLPSSQLYLSQFTHHILQKSHAPKQLILYGSTLFWWASLYLTFLKLSLQFAATLRSNLLWNVIVVFFVYSPPLVHLKIT